MKKMLIGAMALSLAAGSAALAQPYGHGPANQGPPGHMQGRDNQGPKYKPNPKWGREYGANHHWRRGQRMGYNDWQGAQAVDYRQHRLRRPPKGYEWRESNGQYILGAIATGLIASIILNNH